MARPSFFYRLSLRVAETAAPLAARFDKKIARGLGARAGLTDRLARWADTQRDTARPLVWVHAPSVGEALQAKPVLEALRAERPEWQLAFTFFSPSAERLARTLPVDVTDYSPLDRPGDVTRALAALRPTALVYSKLDVWPELTLAAANAGVRLGLISATVSQQSSRLRWPVRGWATPAYRALDRVGAISAERGRSRSWRAPLGRPTKPSSWGPSSTWWRSIRRRGSSSPRTSRTPTISPGSRSARSTWASPAPCGCRSWSMPERRR